jgi:hypothetical protein
MGVHILPSVEIFKDADSGSVDLDAAFEGIELVAQDTGRLLVESGRRIKLHYGDGNGMDRRPVRWPRFVADFNIVVTDRAFEGDAEHEGYRPVGRSSLYEAGPQAAVVSTESRSVKLTVAHELGHMLGLKRPAGGRLEDIAHCATAACIMHEVSQVIPVKKMIPSTRGRHWMASLGIVEPQFSFSLPEPAHEFCDDCRGDLRLGAVAKFMVKNGLDTASGIY